MRIDKNVTIYAGDDVRTQQKLAAEKQERSCDEEKRDTIFAGELGIDMDMIRQKREQAQKEALKVVRDAWNSGIEAQDELNERRDHIKELQSGMGDAVKKLAELDEEQAALQQKYGVSGDSQEQRDLELLRKQKSVGQPGSDAALTEEERERLKELEAQGLTEYQTRSLELDETATPYRQTLADNQKAIRAENSIIRGTKAELQKRAPMVKAAALAEEIKDEAGREIVGMMMQEGVDHISEEMEKRKEEAEKLKEDKEAQEELIEQRREERKETEELLEDKASDEILELDQYRNETKQELQEILDKMKLVEEDLKGAMVDEVL